MKNQYLFFEKQTFDELDLTEYIKTDIPIPKTHVHIYEFKCAESDACCDDETRAKKLDKLTDNLFSTFPDSFIAIYSETSQYFCRQLYPLVVEFEIKLRQVLYISRTLYKGEDIKADMFQYTVDKKSKTIEELDFGQIYTAIFTDPEFKRNLMQKYDNPLTKADLITIIQDLEESTEWRKIMGKDYHYIENHFLEIKDFRNDVMHNHLISYATYIKAQKVFKAANEELTQAIRDKLITNSSEYLNTVNIFDTIGNIMTALQVMASRVDKIANSEGFANFLKLFVDSAAIPDNLTQLTDHESTEQEDGDNA